MKKREQRTPRGKGGEGPGVGREHENKNEPACAPVGRSGEGFVLFLGRRGPGYRFWAATRELAEKTERLTKCSRRKRTGPRLGGKRWEGDLELRLPPRGHWAGSEGGGREVSLTGS